ncbi:MAG: DUF4105 domain-containing protein [Treponema sp.]|jgi:hypothetical protein|nr:DUF4105 domain-containing protein [Treponema sp.]
MGKPFPPERRFVFLILAMALLASPAGSGAQEPSAGVSELEARGEYLTVKVAVMGPGDELYFWWGHIALVIEDSLLGQSRFYDYGIFSFESENFYLNFAMGRLLYRCGVSPAELNYRVYTVTNRDITLYTLDLPPETREEVRRFAEHNVLPENRNYYYHHFKDNCATRIRDILDLATAGQFREAFGEAPSPFTLRQQVRRHTWFSPFMDWLLNFLMGQDIDVPITAWEEMFLPQAIGNYILDFSYTDVRGVERKLVSDVEILNRAVNRPPVLERPRRQWIRELALGLAVAAFLVCLQFYRKKRPGPGGVLWGAVQALLGLFFGIAGTVLFFMTFFTDHDYTWHNINVLFVNPLWFAVAVWGIRVAAARNAEKRARPEFLLKCFWTAAGILCFLTMPVKLLPFFYQQNQVTQALFLPVALVLGWFPQWVLKKRPALRRR